MELYLHYRDIELYTLQSDTNWLLYSEEGIMNIVKLLLGAEVALKTAGLDIEDVKYWSDEKILEIKDIGPQTLKAIRTLPLDMVRADDINSIMHDLAMLETTYKTMKGKGMQLPTREATKWLLSGRAEGQSSRLAYAISHTIHGEKVLKESLYGKIADRISNIKFDVKLTRFAINQARMVIAKTIVDGLIHTGKLDATVKNIIYRDYEGNAKWKVETTIDMGPTHVRSLTRGAESVPNKGTLLVKGKGGIVTKTDKLDKELALLVSGMRLRLVDTDEDWFRTANLLSKDRYKKL